jgi:hypothetical protein
MVMRGIAVKQADCATSGRMTLQEQRERDDKAEPLDCELDDYVES